MLKRYKNEIFFFYIFTAAALICALFFDLKLDIFLNNPKSPFAIWFCNTGEMPSRLICPLAGLLIYKLAKKKLHRNLGLFIELAGSAYLGYHIADYFFVEENQILFGIIYGFGFGLFLLFLGNFIVIPKEYEKALLVLSIAGIAVMAVQTLTVEGIKFLWGRVRFRDLLAAGSYDMFTPFTHPNGINGNKSFPSGHTAGAGMSYLLLTLPYLSEKFSKRKTLLFAIAFCYTGIVALTRLIMGAHYLSDVAVGSAISFTCVIISTGVIEKKKLLINK
ncbi:MAG: phosphatase PAP2 family protein [Eubacterium sp.]|nr:phosphatase PAP2 family protein [Eubacterium sp.]